MVDKNNSLVKLMDKYHLQAQHVAHLINIKRYSVHNLRNGIKKFKAPDAYFLLNKLKTEYETKIEEIDKDLKDII